MSTESPPEVPGDSSSQASSSTGHTDTPHSNQSGSSTRLIFSAKGANTVASFVVELAKSISRQLRCDLCSVQMRDGDELYSHCELPSKQIIVRSGTAEVDLNKVELPSDSGRFSEHALFQVDNAGAMFRGQVWQLPLIVNDLQRARVPSELALELAVRKVRSCGIFPIIDDGQTVGVVECLFTRGFHRWKQEELAEFQSIPDLLRRTLAAPEFVDTLSETEKPESSAEELKNQYRRLARYGNIIILITDSNFEITDIVGNTEQLLGVSNATMLHNSDIWDVILDSRDRGLLKRRILRLKNERDELREEVRFVHQATGEVRWVMLRALPQFSSSGVFQGWEGFGIDTTDRRRAQEALMAQNRRLEAVFEVSRAIQGQTDPALVTLKGLRALIRATRADAGYGCFCQNSSASLEVVATFGLSEEYLAGVEKVLRGPSLLTHVIDQKQGVLVHDLQNDPRAVNSLAKSENLRSTIVMPLLIDSKVFGAIVLFKREVQGYNEADFDLVSSAATQIALAVRQAELYEIEKRHNESLRALYRISHELAKYRTPREIAEHAFPLLIQEFSLKRIWFGVMNEQGTHLVGKAAVGPGMRRQLQDVQVELALQHDILDEAIRTQSTIFSEAGKALECSGLNRIMARLKVDCLGVIPLVSLGQVIGALVVEPMQPALLKQQGPMQLLSSMASEIATVLMSRRFEQKMSDALKMRMAGLLASGVAHNFNNLLQAVLGQVALIEMQIPKDSPALDATRTINDAAKRGATLVSQLLNFASHGQVSRQSIAIGRMLSDSRELYQSLIGSRIELVISEGEECPEVVADLSQIQQVVTNLLVNAKDAIGARQGGKVEISVHHVRLRSGEIDPELAPGSYIRIDVKDNGIGMNAEQQARCFEPFFTTKNADRTTGVGLAGSGLGLSAAYSLIKQHEGVITAHSAPREGSLFSVFLPSVAARDDSRVGVVQAVTPKLVKGGVIHLGIETGVQPFLVSIFDSLGYRARSAFDFRQVQEIIQRDKGIWRYVLVDADVLKEEVLKISSQLLLSHTDIGLLVTSASAGEWRDQLPSSARIEVLEKPFGVWSIDGALRRLSSRIEAIITPRKVEVEKSVEGDQSKLSEPKISNDIDENERDIKPT